MVTNYSNSISKKGDAIWETTGNINGSYAWFSDYTYMPNGTYPMIIRSSKFDGQAGGGIFGFSYHEANPYPHLSFRPVLAVKPGL
jgi:hypothetical protein